jgi:hypothetical protein
MKKGKKALLASIVGAGALATVPTISQAQDAAIPAVQDTAVTGQSVLRVGVQPSPGVPGDSTSPRWIFDARSLNGDPIVVVDGVRIFAVSGLAQYGPGAANGVIVITTKASAAPQP